jgi:hypothetical protein
MFRQKRLERAGDNVSEMTRHRQSTGFQSPESRRNATPATSGSNLRARSGSHYASGRNGRGRGWLKPLARRKAAAPQRVRTARGRAASSAPPPAQSGARVASTLSRRRQRPAARGGPARGLNKHPRGSGNDDLARRSKTRRCCGLGIAVERADPGCSGSGRTGAPAGGKGDAGAALKRRDLQVSPAAAHSCCGLLGTQAVLSLVTAAAHLKLLRSSADILFYDAPPAPLRFHLRLSGHASPTALFSRPCPRHKMYFVRAQLSWQDPAQRHCETGISTIPSVPVNRQSIGNL